jgi:Na+/melibiose symporter-like transporter
VPTRKVSPLSQIAIGVSGMPTSGLVSNGIDYFLLFFYSQIVGLSPGLAGLALAIALAFDAVSDPVMGYLSDHWRSALKRRHPFMYTSIVPIAGLYIAIW